MNTELKDALEYWESKGMECDIHRHNSPAEDLNEFDFHYRSAESVEKNYVGEGLFAHCGDEYFNKFGRNQYFVISRTGRNNVAYREEESGNGHMEAFIQKSAVLEIIKI
jgi:hypothetical protein